ncbi:MAG: hypothetical protein Q9178_008021 [Gyalolechia marmorata]
MKVKSQGYAVMDEVDISTFVRFLEWTYSGTYTAVTPEDESSPNDIAPAKDNSHQSDVVESDVVKSSITWGLAKEKKKCIRKSELGSFGFGDIVIDPTSRDGLRQAFIDRSYTGLESTLPVPRARENESENESYRDLFLCYAQVYVFADRWQINKLKTFALQSLHETLKHFTLYEKRTSDIISLLRYVYHNTQPPEETGSESLRALLTDYVGFEMDTLMKDANFETLMIEDGGPLLGNFVKMVIQRIG